MADEGLELKTYKYQTGAVYTGQFKGTKRHGKGHWRHPDGETYEGQYVDNKQNGYGIYVWEKSDKRYLGTWQDGKMHGEGIYFFNSGHNTYYCGGYMNDKKHGQGYYLYENGVMTHQSWEDGALKNEQETTPAQRVQCARKVRDLFTLVRQSAPKLLGEQPAKLEANTFTFQSGATYNGQYSGMKKHGQGFWWHPEGDSYEGTFEDNKHCGWGVYSTGRSGKKYVGQWENGKMNGWGVYFFNNQETEYFVGQYKEDKKDGIGMYHFAETGTSHVQVWSNGEIMKDTPAEEDSIAKFIAAIREIIATVGPFAPSYHSSAFGSA